MRMREIMAEARAFHGTDQRFEAFSLDHFGTGDGASTFGWGIYLSSAKAVASRYRKRGTGVICEVDMPEPDELLDWNRPLSAQPAAVRQAIMGLGYPAIRQQMIEIEMVAGYDGPPEGDTGEEVYGIFIEHCYEASHDHIGSKRDASLLLLKAGVAGIQYLDVESGSAKIPNYVIFDPRRIQIRRKLP